MNDIDFDTFLAELSSLSEDAFIDPGSVDWPDRADPDAWYFTPELVSLYGTETWRRLDERARKRLSLAEAVNFFSLNIHGEKYLIGEISRRLYGAERPELSRYLLHFVDEEARHMMYFSGFCRRYGQRVYADRTLHGDDGLGEDLDFFLLFARINVFEEIVDHYNRTMARDPRVAPIARAINRIHHVEELRHLRFGRQFLKCCLDEHADDWGPSLRDDLRQRLSGYLEFVWKQYYNPDAYADAGIDDPFGTWQTVADSSTARTHRRTVNRRRLSYLRKLGLLEAA